MLVSPFEPEELRGIGTVSNRPEECGADFLFPTRAWGLMGVQRKALSDLVSSFYSGRLWLQMMKMAEKVDQSVLLIEGEPRWAPDGSLLARSKWSQAQHWGLILNASSAGCWVSSVNTTSDCSRWLLWFEKWGRKRHHHGLETRPGPERKLVSGTSRTARDRAVHLMQGIEGVGPVEAGKIWDHFGRVPWKWDVGMEELMLVQGVGVEKARKMMEALGK